MQVIFQRLGRHPAAPPVYAMAHGPAAPFIALGASVLSTGLGVIGQIQQGSAQAAAQANAQAMQANAQAAQAAQANYQAQVARNNQEMQRRNAAILEQNAHYAEDQGVIAEDRLRQKASQMIGSKRAVLASQGSDINDGSDVDLIADTARAGEFDALATRSDAQHRAYAIRLDAMEAENRANLAGTQDAIYSQAAARYAQQPAANSLDSLALKVAPSLLSAASSVARLFI